MVAVKQTRLQTWSLFRTDLAVGIFSYKVQLERCLQGTLPRMDSIVRGS